MTDQPKKIDRASALAGILAGVGLVLAATCGVFLLIVHGIFMLMMSGNTGVYVLFYGGAVVLTVLAGVAMAASMLLCGRKKGGAAAATAQPPSALSRGITVGLVTVVAAVLLFVGLFFWMSR